MTKGILVGLLFLCCGLSACAASPKADTPAARVVETPQPTPPATAAPTPSAATPAEEATQVCYATGEGVRVRAQADGQSPVRETLALGTAVFRLETVGDWCRIRYGQEETGYVHMDDLSTVCPTARPTPPAVVEEGTAIVVYKGARRLELWEDGALFGSWQIGLGWEPQGDKNQEGDGKTPEGDYAVCLRNAASSYYLSLGVSYPNEEDARRALEDERIDQATYRQIARAQAEKKRPPWNTAIGGQIMIHGHGGDRDWTAGCIAVEDAVMDILWAHCPLGTPICIRP
ncbi:MAG: L,D-transpeptidase family protein [Eubacteriales bacterium]|nr:L,D-transpeptidase family protein [Eubacteriales bacterium]